MKKKLIKALSFIIGLSIIGVSIPVIFANNAPKVISAKATTKTEIEVKFSKKMVLPKKSSELSFLIEAENNEDELLLVWLAEFKKDSKGKTDKTTITLTTDEQVKGKKYVASVISTLVTDEDGTPIESDVTDSATFVGVDNTKATTRAAAPEVPTPVTPSIPTIPKTIRPPTKIKTPTLKTIRPPTSKTVRPPTKTTTKRDKNPPEDITNFIVNFQKRAKDCLIKLSWMPSRNKAGDLAEQLLYHSLSKGRKWDTPISLKKDTSNYQMKGKYNTEHTFKITQKDKTGNESTGVIKSIRLPQTGPLTLLFFGIGLTGAGLTGLRRKTKNKNKK